MFTGIIQKKGKVSFLERVSNSGAPGIYLRIETGYTDLALGESVAINGVCLTVTESEHHSANGQALFFLSGETLECTHLGSLQAGSSVNLERALQANDRLSGHIVQGHIDGKGQIKSITAQGESHLLEIQLTSQIFSYCVEKGSIAINGVSLTINQLLPQNQISITLIPHTWLHTCFLDSKIGDIVNIEIDVLAKYVEKLCQPYRKH